MWGGVVVTFGRNVGQGQSVTDLPIESNLVDALDLEVLCTAQEDCGNHGRARDVGHAHSILETGTKDGACRQTLVGTIGRLRI